MIDFLKKHKERVTLVGMGIAFLFFVVGGIYLQKKNRQEKEILPEVVPKTVELKVQKQGEDEKRIASVGKVASFFLKPSPDELLAELASMENLNKDVVNAKYSYLRVMWPAYFFILEKTEAGKATVLLDVSEDGFGVIIRSEIETVSHPQLLELAEGEKVWIAGEILAVDLSGTGTIYLETEHITIGGDPPISHAMKKNEK